MTELQTQALAALAEVWKLSPDVRLGQLMAHLGFLAETHFHKGLGTINEDDLLTILYQHRAELRTRVDEQIAAEPPLPHPDLPDDVQLLPMETFLKR